MLGNFKENSTVDFKFNTRNAGATLTTFVGGAVTVYKGSGTTNAQSGVTLITNLNSITGLNHVNIDLASNAGFYTTGSDYAIVVLSGTVAGTSVVGEVLESFSIRNRAHVLDYIDGVEPSYTLQQAMRLVLSAAAGKISGAETTTVWIRDVGDTKNRLQATVTESGNRTDIIYDIT